MKTMISFLFLLLTVCSSVAGDLPDRIGRIRLGMTAAELTSDIGVSIKDCLSDCSEYEKYVDLDRDVLDKIVIGKDLETMELFFWKGKLYFIMWATANKENVEIAIGKLGSKYQIKKNQKGLTIYKWTDSRVECTAKVNKRGDVVGYSLKDLRIDTSGSQW